MDRRGSLLRLGLVCGWLASGCDEPLVVFQPRLDGAVLTDGATPEIAASVAAGDQFSCALLSDGSTYCWGQNEHGQLGTTSPASTLTPVLADRVPPLTALAAGLRFACGIGTDARVYCWGDNELGELGDGSTTSRSNAVAVTLPGSVTAIGLGGEHACAIVSDGALYCWGNNLGQQLASGVDTSPIPLRIGTDAYRAVAGGFLHTCAIRTDGRLFCWGFNGDSELGVDRDDVTIAAPVQVSDDVWTAIDLGQEHSCGIHDGNVYCWGHDARTIGNMMGIPLSVLRTPTLIAEGDFVSVAADWFSSCAIRVDGRAAGWGRNWEGQLALGEVAILEATELPRADWQGFSLGRLHTCGVVRGGDVYCMGENTGGQLGVGDDARRGEPTRVELP